MVFTELYRKYPRQSDDDFFFRKIKGKKDTYTQTRKETFKHSKIRNETRYLVYLSLKDGCRTGIEVLLRTKNDRKLWRTIITNHLMGHLMSEIMNVRFAWITYSSQGILSRAVSVETRCSEQFCKLRRHYFLLFQTVAAKILQPCCQY